jgi:hypothetical protein
MSGFHCRSKHKPNNTQSLFTMYDPFVQILTIVLTFNLGFYSFGITLFSLLLYIKGFYWFSFGPRIAYCNSLSESGFKQPAPWRKILALVQLSTTYVRKFTENIFEPSRYLTNRFHLIVNSHCGSTVWSNYACLCLSYTNWHFALQFLPKVVLPRPNPPYYHTDTSLPAATLKWILAFHVIANDHHATGHTDDVIKSRS